MANLKYTVLAETKRYVPKFKLHGTRTTFKINEPAEGTDELKWCEAAISDIINKVKKECAPTDQIGFSFSSDQFKKGDGYLAFKPARELQPEDVWNVIFSLFQSSPEDGIKTTDTFRLNIVRVELPTGSGRRRSGFYSTFEEDCRKRHGIVVIDNKNDDLCLARALAVGIAHADKDPEFKKMRQNVGKAQEEKGKQLMEAAGVTITAAGAGIPELQLFQQYLKNYKITVYQYGAKGRNVIFEGTNPDAVKKINLIYEKNHFNVITSLTSAFGCKYFCEDCRVSYDHKNRHKCKTGCKMCGAKNKCVKVMEIVCDDCARDFNSEECFKNHQENKFCKKFKKCRDCLKILDMEGRKKPHVCGEFYCKLCRDHKSSDHKCYMKKDSRKPPKDGYLFQFFDLETMQEKNYPGSEEVKIHEPNLCVVQKSCFRCQNNDEENCESCGQRQIELYGSNVISRFMDQLMEVKKFFKTVCCISHNGGMFDVQFILKYILDNTRYLPKVIMRGTKIVVLEIDNVRFIDSLNYLPMGLAKLPKAFDLPPAIKKGYFPHFFNTRENQFYKGPIPDKKYFGVDSMFSEDRSKFLDWYEEQKRSGFVFDMHKELIEYCVSDVTILKEACMKFRSYFLTECNVDPFLESLTIASACNLMYRRNFLKPDTIGLIPVGGYRKADRQSKVALKWLLTEEMERNITINHAGRNRETNIHGLKVDGYCEETGQIFEFQGDYFHGCPKCFPVCRDRPLHDDPNDTLQLRYERTQDKIKKLKSFGYEVIEKWECDFVEEKDLKKNPDYLEDHPMIVNSPLNPRDAFFGGRTGCTKLYYKAEDGEIIRYVDVCSLYPWVCKYGRFPIGHPTVHVGEDCMKLVGDTYDLSKIEGLIKCKILPPRNLYHPVLPVKQNEKLVFSLCRTCGEIENKSECDHSDDDRMLNGTWTIPEVRKAQSKGYKIQAVYEIWNYSVVQYDKVSKTQGLFTEFINKFLKIKQEASGFPAECSTEQEKQKYIDDFLNAEGIKMDSSKIKSNPGLRSLAKLMLNSFWGRFGMRENQSQTSIINQPSEWFSLFANPSSQVKTVQEINDETVLVHWDYREEALQPHPTVNVVIAAYTTSQARLKLYEYLELLDRQVLYYDTDSVIYSYKSGQNEVKTGSFLGEMTDELEGYGSGSYITEFVSGGPKTYAYKVHSPSKNKTSYLCKVKGLTLNFLTAQIINFDTLKNMILKEEKEEETNVIVNTSSILRTTDRDVVTVPTSKRFQINITKRRRVDNYDTEPFGYKRARCE